MKHLHVEVVVFPPQLQLTQRIRRLLQLHLSPKSGIPVTVHFPESSNFQELYLEGDARLVYRGELTKEALIGFPWIGQAKIRTQIFKRGGGGSTSTVSRRTKMEETTYAVLQDDRFYLVDPRNPQAPVSGERSAPVAECKIFIPTTPSKIIGVGLNYKDHAEERNKPIPKEPLLFLKPSSALIAYA